MLKEICKKINLFSGNTRLLHGVFLCGILLCALLLRGAFLWNVTDEAFYHNDGHEYMDIGKNLAAGKGFSLSYYRWHEVEKPGFRKGVDTHTDLARTPVLPLLGAAVCIAAPEEPALTRTAKVCSLVLSLLAVYCVFLLGKEFAGTVCGLWSSWIFTFYPYAIYYAGSWSTENLFLIFLCLSMTFFLKVLHGKEEAFVWCAVFLALGTLTRPTAILLAGILPVLAYLYFAAAGRPEERAGVIRPFREWQWRLPLTCYRKFWKYCGIFLLVFFLLMMPWTIRNRIAGGSWNMTSYYGGYVFFLSFSEIFMVTYETLDRAEYTPKTAEAWNRVHASYQKKLRKMGIYEFTRVMDQWKKWGFEQLKAHPERIGYLLKERFIHYWRMCPNLIVLTPMQIVLIRIYFSALFLFALGGWILYGKTGASYVLVMPVFFGLVISIPFLFVLRYRFPFFGPYLCVLAGGCAAALWTFLKNAVKKSKEE